MLERAFSYTERMRDAYLAATPYERRAWNQLVFRGFWVGDRQVQRYEYQDHFRDLVEYSSSNKGHLVDPRGFEPLTF
jgi:hypothetical protein